MSNNTDNNPADVLILSAVKTLGKREFLKSVERLFKSQPVREKQDKAEVVATEQCIARVKGDRTGLKVGRYVIFDNCRCQRGEVSSESHLCAIHTNQVVKFGKLDYGKYSESLTDEQKKIFGDI